MGTGDWNDGMDEVGAQGRGESVWLGWFLGIAAWSVCGNRRGPWRRSAGRRLSSACRKTEGRARGGVGRRVVPARVLRRRYAARIGREHRVSHRRDRAELVRHLGSGRGRSARARPWSRWTNGSIDRDARLILLLTPPFDKAQPNPGYIRGYVPGVRENGGQYTHAALWVGAWRRRMLGHGDAAHELLSFINPINRSRDVNRREAIPRRALRRCRRHLFGARSRRTWWVDVVHRRGGVDVPRDTRTRARHQARRRISAHRARGARRMARLSVTLRIDGAEYVIQVENAAGTNGATRVLTLDGSVAESGKIPLVPGSGRHTVRLVMGQLAPAVAPR